MLPAGNRSVELLAGHKVENTRLDQYLVGVFPDYSRSVIRKAIDAGAVMVNGKEAKASYRIRTGDRVHILLPEPTHEIPLPEDIPLDILYEDEFLAIINKPADMVVHPAKGHWSGTLVNALQFHFGAEKNGDWQQKENCLSPFFTPGNYRPGIVHRLDRDTSGVILVAKEETTHRELSYQFETRKVFKEYRALTAGELDRDSDYIEGRIRRHPHDRVKMAVTGEEEEGKEACSFYEVLERFRGYSFCRIFPRTGRTHQIRVHLASIGCPVLADKIYSGRDRLHLSDLFPDLEPEADRVLLSRQALHAARLRFVHPRLRKTIEAEAPLPPEFENTLAALRHYRPMC